MLFGKVMAHNKKEEIISFKADYRLSEALKTVPNRSEFIRTAILAALKNLCPLCNGTGILTPEQQSHWENFAENHKLVECKKCHSTYLKCIVKDA
jgi:uncharacterized protein with PIN domain